MLLCLIPVWAYSGDSPGTAKSGVSDTFFLSKTSFACFLLWNLSHKLQIIHLLPMPGWLQADTSEGSIWFICTRKL